MKIENEEILKTAGDNLDSIQATVDSEKMSKMFWMFSNLYKDVLGSIIREYTSNCFDSHAEAKVDDPVVIKLVESLNTGDYFISFIDVGVGLSPYRVQNIFMKYLSSTKEDTNDQIGGWGMGSKSGLAYQDKIHIQTIFEGTEWTYILHKGETGVPTLEKLLEIPTTKRNGTTITIKLNKSDSYSVYANLKTQLRYFDNVYVDDQILKGLFENKYTIYEGKYFKFNTVNQPTQTEIVLGKVRYAIDFLQLGIETKYIPIAIKFDIGELQVTPSREDILYSAVAKQKIIDRIKMAEDELVELFNKTYNPVISIKDWYDNKSQQYIHEFPCGATINLERVLKDHPEFTPIYCPEIVEIGNEFGELKSKAILRNILSFSFETVYAQVAFEYRSLQNKFIQAPGYNQVKYKYFTENYQSSNVTFLRHDPNNNKVNSKYTNLYVSELIRTSQITIRISIIKPAPHRWILKNIIKYINLQIGIVATNRKNSKGKTLYRRVFEILQLLSPFDPSTIKPYSTIVPSEAWIKEYKEKNAAVVQKKIDSTSYLKINVSNDSTYFHSHGWSLDHCTVSHAFMNSAKKLVILGTEESLATNFLTQLYNDHYHKILGRQLSKKAIAKLKLHFPFLYGIASQSEIKALKKNNVKFKTLSEYMTTEFSSPELLKFLKWRRLKKAFTEADIRMSHTFLETIRKDLGVGLLSLKDFLENRAYSPQVPSFVQELIEIADKKAEEAGYFNNLDELNLISELVKIQKSAPMLMFIQRLDFTDQFALDALRDYCKKSQVKMDSHHYIIKTSVPEKSSEETEILETIENEVTE